MEKDQALAALAALANDARLTLVRLLMPRGDAGMAAGDIGRKQARNVFYSVDAGGMGQTIAFLLNDCCMDHPEVVACCRHGRSVTTPMIQTPASSTPSSSTAEPPLES